MDKIKPNIVYNTKEIRNFLKISESTLKRWLKTGIIQANKIGGTYKILGAEVLRLISPKAENKTSSLYRKFRDKTKSIIKDW